MTSSVRPSVPGPDLPRDPADTIVVTGGTGVAAVDAAEVRRAAARVAAAAEYLRRAAALSGAAWAEVASSAMVPVPAAIGPGTAVPNLGGARSAPVARVGDAVSGPVAARSGGFGSGTGVEGAVGIGHEAAAMRRAASDAVEVVTSGLRERAGACDLLGWRLLRAAGLYEEAEGLVERLVGGLVTAEGFVVGTALGIPPVVRLLGGVYRAIGNGTAESPAARERPAGEHGGGGGRGRTAGGSGGAVVRGIAPWTDELAYGFGHGLAWSTGARPGVPGAAGELADAVRAAPLGTLGRNVRLERAQLGEFGGGPPAWRGRGAATLDEALSRIDDLSPRRGAPAATIAVQRVVGRGETASWVVLVPGTQSVPPADHPWDGLTDLELVAEHPDQVTEAVEGAMSDAGVGPDEPVVLVGHSLGGIAVTALASRSAFAERYRIGGVVTAGSPVATFRTPPGVPVLHLETAEEVVSGVDGRSSAENPRTPDRVTVGRTLADSSAGADRAASGVVSAAHSIPTHARTLVLARESGDVRVSAAVDRIEPLLRGDRVETTFYRAERVAQVRPEPAPEPAPSPGPPPRAPVSPGASPGPAGPP